MDEVDEEMNKILKEEWPLWQKQITMVAQQTSRPNEEDTTKLALPFQNNTKQTGWIDPRGENGRVTDKLHQPGVAYEHPGGKWTCNCKRGRVRRQERKPTGRISTRNRDEQLVRRLSRPSG